MYNMYTYYCIPRSLTDSSLPLQLARAQVAVKQTDLQEVLNESKLVIDHLHNDPILQLQAGKLHKSWTKLHQQLTDDTK